MRISSFSFQNLEGRSNEDFYLASKKYPIFTVADGISRTRNKNGNYPKSSGARLAAELFCKAAIAYLEKNYKKINLKILKNAFNSANQVIFNLNEKSGINKKLDYLGNDYFSTCGAAVFIKNNFLYCGYLGDCGIRIYDKNDFLKFVSVDDVAVLEGWRDNQKFKLEKEKLLIWRKVLRNKPKVSYLTYGVFSGEPEAKHYYHFDRIKLSPGDLIFLYSDGFLYFIKKPAFRKLFLKFNGGQLSKEISRFIKKEIESRLIVKENSETFLDDKTLTLISI